MDTLKFPDFSKEPPLPPPVISMDEYVEFCEYYVRNLVDRKTYEREQQRSTIKVPFRLK